MINKLQLLLKKKEEKGGGIVDIKKFKTPVDTTGPYGVVVTNHARKRIIERLKCHPNKVEKIARKAAKSSDATDKFITYRKHTQDKNDGLTCYKVLMGFLFIFHKDHKQRKMVLVTAYPASGKDFHPLKK